MNKNPNNISSLRKTDEVVIGEIKTVDYVILEINESIKQNCNALICDVCTGGGYDYENSCECEKCKGSGIANWDFDYLNGELKKSLTTLIEQVRKEEYNKLSYWLEHKPTCFLYTNEGSSDYCTCGLTKALT